MTLLLDRYRPLVDDFEAFREYSRRPLPTCVWSHPLLADSAIVEGQLALAELGPQPLGWLPGAFRLSARGRPGYLLPFLAGRCHVQEEVSLVPPLLLDPQPGERVLDMCAAPGGKTVRIALAMANRGTVVANDRSASRIRGLRNNLERLSVLNVIGTGVNAATLPASFGAFDRILCDVPCSGQGNSRKSGKVLLEDVDLDRGLLVRLQETILMRAFQMCRPGGRIVYSTCTYAPEENEGVVDSVLGKVGGALRVVPTEIPGLTHSPGVTHWGGARYAPALEGALRFWPHQNDTGGFFAVVLEKAEDAAPSRGHPIDPKWRPAEADVSPSFDVIERRFGMSRDAFAGLRFFHTARRHAEMISQDASPPRADFVQFRGARFCHVQSVVPLPSSVTARTFGGLARRNVIELRASEVASYVGRETFPIHAESLGSEDSPGWVLVRHDDMVLGTGMLRGTPGGGFSVESLFPKGYARPGY